MIENSKALGADKRGLRAESHKQNKDMLAEKEKKLNYASRPKRARPLSEQEVGMRRVAAYKKFVGER